jgi:hypothetical protein
MRKNETGILIGTDLSGKILWKWKVEGVEPIRKYLPSSIQATVVFQLWIERERRASAVFWLR